MAAALFWLCAIVQMFVSLGFLHLVRQLDGSRVDARVKKLVRGQRQDAWLAAALVWARLILRGEPYVDVLLMAGTGGLIWLTVRASQRVDALQGSARE